MGSYILNCKHGSKSISTMCYGCGARKLFIDFETGKLSNYCSISCRDAPKTRPTVPSGGTCKKCRMRPVHVGRFTKKVSDICKVCYDATHSITTTTTTATTSPKPMCKTCHARPVYVGRFYGVVSSVCTVCYDLERGYQFRHSEVKIKVEVDAKNMCSHMGCSLWGSISPDFPGEKLCTPHHSEKIVAQRKAALMERVRVARLEEQKAQSQQATEQNLHALYPPRVIQTVGCSLKACTKRFQATSSDEMSCCSVEHKRMLDCIMADKCPVSGCFRWYDWSNESNKPCCSASHRRDYVASMGWV